MNCTHKMLSAVLACAVSVLVLFAAMPALAHKVNIFAYVEAGQVYTESYFPDGRPVAAGTVKVFGNDGGQLLEGTCDQEGVFSFTLTPAMKQDLTIEIDASMGHKNSFLLKKEELGQ